MVRDIPAGDGKIASLFLQCTTASLLFNNLQNYVCFCMYHLLCQFHCNGLVKYNSFLIIGRYFFRIPMPDPTRTVFRIQYPLVLLYCNKLCKKRLLCLIIIALDVLCLYLLCYAVCICLCVCLSLWCYTFCS
jgi:hypothetical protein